MYKTLARKIGMKKLYLQITLRISSVKNTSFWHIK